MSDWSGPTPIPQQYPGHPTDGIGQIVGLVKDQATRMREITSNLLRSMGVRARPGQMSSLDYDGTSHAALGTAGWALASDNGGPSYLALNGIDVYADLAAKTATLASQQATLNTTVTNLATAQATLTAQQADLTSQLASINALIGQQVAVGSGTASTSGAVGVSAGGDYATTTIAVPSGYSQAQVFAVSGAISLSGTLGGGITLAVNIAGGIGNGLPCYPNVSTAGAASPSHSRLLTGLSGGSISVSSRVTAASGSPSVYMTTTVMAVFLR